ncbi:MAG: FecR family protein [Spirochaetales bacterium]|nr:FecR family protein [Spirochaetales bacterium]
MKKTILIILCLFITASLWADVSITDIKGKVELMLPGSGSWSAAGEGDTVPAGTRISTGFNSTAVLVVNGDTRVNLKALTRIKMEEAIAQSDGSQNTSLFLSSGRLQADVKKKEGSFHDFRVSSPVATAAVRGTRLDMSPSRLTVLEGIVQFSLGDYSFTLQRSQSAKITIVGSTMGLDPPTEQVLGGRTVNTNTSQNRNIVTTSGSPGSKVGYALIELR